MGGDSFTARPALDEPPGYCQYAAGPCDQDFGDSTAATGLFLYGSEPAAVADVIEAATERLSAQTGSPWATWKDLKVGGRIIFCEICKALRGATTVYADVTALNFNLMFEIGFCLGLGVLVQPIRDPTYLADQKLYDVLGLLDTVGYLDFTTSDTLVTKALGTSTGIPVGNPPAKPYTDSPIYVLKGHIETEGELRLLSVLKKAHWRFRAYDPTEGTRLSLHNALKQIRGSAGIVAHLLSPNRDGALVHNARCALLCGIALAEQKVVVMIQEESHQQPIDYRDLILSYKHPRDIDGLVEPALRQVIDRIQDGAPAVGRPMDGLLEELDLGDTAAENEIGGLKDYFVRTGEFKQALQGHARLIVGRKGAGKTAIFYEVRNSAKRGRERIVLDLKPEGHQFTRLREAVLSELLPGQQEYTIAAFWTYILSAEVAHKILNDPAELRAAELIGGEHFDRYKALEDAYLEHGLASADDFSQRLLRQVDRISERVGSDGPVTQRTNLAELLFGGDIKTLNDAVAAYLGADQYEVWLLVDNLDKSWATRGTRPEDVQIVLGLLDASRELERQLERRNVLFHALVFIRADVYEHLLEQTPDRGKDTPIRLEWDDVEFFKQIVARRITASTELRGKFEEVWAQLGPSHVKTQDTMSYMLDRTLLRPRDLLMFLQRCVDVAMNRGHPRILEDDILQAEKAYSEDMFINLVYEVQDTNPGLADALYAFQGAKRRLERRDVEDMLSNTGLKASDIDQAVEMLLWFGFLGIEMRRDGEESYSHMVRFNLRRLQEPLSSGAARLVIHPAFCESLAVA